MRSDRLYLSDIGEAVEAIARFTNGVESDHFLRDELLQSAVLQKLLVIGEAAARLSKELRERHPHVPWQRIIAFRNFAIHAYFAVDWSIVWATATVDVAELRKQIASVIQQEFLD